MTMKFHHIGIACKNIELEIKNLKKVHKVTSVSRIMEDEMQDASLCMVSTDDGLNIELVSGPRTENIVKKGLTYYHVGYSVNDIEASIKDLVGKGAILVSGPKPAVLFNGKKVAFLMLPYGLAELVEE